MKMRQRHFPQIRSRDLQRVLRSSQQQLENQASVDLCCLGEQLTSVDQAQGIRQTK